jgi:hypothetical protein
MDNQVRSVAVVRPFVITVYGKENGEFINRFMENGYAVLADTVNGGNYDFLKSNYVGPHRFYAMDEQDELIEYEDPEVEPDFCLALNVGDNEPDWDAVFCWLKKILFNVEEDEVMMPPGIIEQRMGLEEEVVVDHGKQEYEFTFKILDDVVFYEVWKPNTDRPYTVVINNFSVVGHEPFFSSLFVCESWGVATADYTFLKRVWEHLEMGPGYDLEKLVKQHTEECKNGKTEPRVYRKGLESVVRMFTEIGSKRKFHGDERIPKMLVLK